MTPDSFCIDKLKKLGAESYSTTGSIHKKKTKKIEESKQLLEKKLNLKAILHYKLYYSGYFHELKVNSFNDKRFTKKLVHQFCAYN